jgi:uncharacterized protein with beta-barrel porin domain
MFRGLNVIVHPPNHSFGRSKNFNGLTKAQELLYFSADWCVLSQDSLSYREKEKPHMPLKSNRTRCLWTLVATAALLLVLLAQPALAVTKQWVGTPFNNLWTTASNWSPPGEPGGGDDVFVTQSGFFPETVIYNTSIKPIYSSLTIDATGSGNITLQQSGNALSANNETIGLDGKGAYNQSGGNNTVNSNLYLGYNPTGSGTYTLEGGNLTVGGYEYIGNSGIGSFTQTGGNHTVTQVLTLAENPNSSGTYNLGSGSLSASGERIGNTGTGTFIQTGGTHTISSGILLLGVSSTGSGTYILSGGSLSVGSDISVYVETIGNSGTGTFIQTGGTHTVSNSIGLGIRLGSSVGSGTYILSGGSLSAVGESIQNGSFIQSGGTNTVKSLSVSQVQAAGSSTYNLEGGSLSAGSESIGSGSFIQSGGINTADTLDILTGSGTYNLKGGSLSTIKERVGAFGPGSFSQTGGNHTISSDLILGDRSTGSGTYTLEGGNLTVGGYENIGNSGIGSFTQIGGIHTETFQLNLGNSATGSGTYDLKGGLLSTNFESIGLSGTGSFTQTAGNHTVANVLLLGQNPDGSGTYNLYGGNLSASSEFIGNTGSGTFTQAGGNHTIANTLSLGDVAGSNGTYNLSGGNLSAANEFIGRGLAGSSTGTFTQTGGINTVTNTLTLSANNGSSGTYNYLGGILSAPTIQINAGGTFNVTGISPTLTSSVMNSGTFKTNNANVSVVGSFTQTASGTYTSEIASAGNYGRIAVTGTPGTATLEGTLSPVLLGGYRPLGNTVFPGIVTANGGISGTFSSVDDQMLSPTLFWQPHYSATSVDLVVQRDYTNPALSLNSNQLAVGTMLNSLAGATSGDLNNLLNAIDSLPNAATVQEAYKQISPEKAGALANLGFVAANFQVRNLATRTTNLRFVQSESGGSASSLAPGGLSCNYSRQGGVMLAYNGGFLPDLFTARKEFKAPESRWGLFADGGAAFGTQSSTSNQTGYNFTLGGLTLGADYRLTNKLLVGLATGYSNTASSFYGTGGSITVNTIPFNAYAAYFSGQMYAYGSLGYALNLYNLRRDINFDGIGRNATSSTNGNQFNLYGEAGYDLKLSRMILTPAATLTYSALWLGGFTESNAGALNLNVGPQNASSVQTGVGGRVTFPLKMGSIIMVPQAYAFYQHEFANGSRGLNASLSQGSSAFTWQTDAAGQNFALVGASLIAGLRENLYAQVNFNSEVGRRNATAQFINAGLRYEF